MTNWYEIVAAEQPLTQGDVLISIPIPRWKEHLVLRGNDNELDVLKESVECVSADLIILTQACDLEHNKVTNVTLCPHFSLSEFKGRWEESKRMENQVPTQKSWESTVRNLNNGFVWNQSLLDKCDLKEHPMEYRVVDFYDIFSLPKSFLESLLVRRNESRLRLLPPYREHLSQTFARFYMRVGLPSTIAFDDLRNS